MSELLAALAVAAAIGMTGRRPPAVRLRAWQVDGTVTFQARDARAIDAGWLLAIVLGCGLAAAHVPIPIVAASFGAVVVARRGRRRRARIRQRDERSLATVEVTVALAGELRAGRTPAQALGSVAATAGPLAPPLHAAAAAVAMGADAADELARAAELPGASRLRYVAAAWAVSDRSGGRVADVLERLGEAMDCDEELRRELDAAMAGPRATMVMLGALPLFGLLLGQSVGAHPFALLLHRPLGWALLGAAGVLDGVGVLVTRAIARSALRG